MQVFQSGGMPTAFGAVSQPLPTRQPALRIRADGTRYPASVATESLWIPSAVDRHPVLVPQPNRMPITLTFLSWLLPGWKPELQLHTLT